MTDITEGPCSDWLEWSDVEDACTPPDTSAAGKAAILAIATRTLWNRTCRQYGVCTIERARVAPRCSHGYTWRAGYGYVASSWAAGHGCGCGSYAFIDLGDEPVVSVEHVWIDGVELDAASYRVDDWRRLVRTDGDVWPASSLQPDEGGENTVEISWTYGVAVPADAKFMAALFACKLADEFANACGADPSGMTNKTAEGITITINPPDGNTGVAIVESWLNNFHCGGGRIFDPGSRPLVARIDT